MKVERRHTQLKQMIWLLEAQKLLSVKYIHWVQMGGMLVQKVNIPFKLLPVKNIQSLFLPKFKEQTRGK